MGFIYKITNNINGKIYIGKTIKTVDKRYSEHVRHSRTVDTYLYYAMRKYGTENFQIETIEEVPDQNLNDREIYWISFYKSNYSQNGYNCTVGGDGNRQIDIYTIEKISELWNGGLTITEIAKTLSLYTATVKNYLEVHCPTYSKEEQKKRGVNSCAEKNSIKILQFDLDGNYIITYNSIEEACAQSGIHRERIKKCCDKIIPNADMYQFIVEGDETPGICVNPVFTNKPVCQRDLSGNIVAMYIHASAAGRELNVDPSCIRRCCYKEKKTCKGCTWDFVSNLEYAEYIQAQNIIKQSQETHERFIA